MIDHLHAVDKNNVKAILRSAGAPVQDPVTSALLLGPIPLKGQGSQLQEYQLAVCPILCSQCLASQICIDFN